MSARQLRRQATTPKSPLINCPSCGTSVELSKYSQHAASPECAGYRAALHDSKDPKIQEKLRKEKDQAELVMKRQTWSQRNWHRLEESGFIQQFWAPSMITLCLLSWLVGYQTPSINFWFTVLIAPSLVAVLITLVFLDLPGKMSKFFDRLILRLLVRAQKKTK